MHTAENRHNTEREVRTAARHRPEILPRRCMWYRRNLGESSCRAKKGILVGEPLVVSPRPHFGGGAQTETIATAGQMHFENTPLQNPIRSNGVATRRPPWRSAWLACLWQGEGPELLSGKFFLKTQATPAPPARNIPTHRISTAATVLGIYCRGSPGETENLGGPKTFIMVCKVAFLRKQG